MQIPRLGGSVLDANQQPYVPLSQLSSQLAEGPISGGGEFDYKLSSTSYSVFVMD